MGILVGSALKHQYEFITSEAKYTALISGLGAGKTEALLYSFLQDLTTIPKASIGVFAPTVDLFRRIHYPRFQEIFESSGILYKLNKSEGVMSVWFPQGKCEIIFRSCDNYSRIIGFELHKAYLDELDVLPADKAMEVWIRVLARTRKRFKLPNGEMGLNQIGVTTTPEGFGFMYNMWVKEHADNPEYRMIKGRTKANHHLPADYVDTLMRTFPPAQIAAYLEGEFVNMRGNTVYDGFDRELSHSEFTINDFPESQMLLIGEDFNVGRSCAVVGMKSTDGDGRLYIVDEIFNALDTPHVIRIIKDRYPDRSITIFPDSSGSSRKSIDSSKSDHRLLRDAGFRLSAPKKNPPVRESVISTNVMFLNSIGYRNLFVNTAKCPNLTEALEKQVYDDHSAPLKDGISDDINDALRYLVNRAYGLAKATTSVVRMRF